jgi:hypothetical protein
MGLNERVQKLRDAAIARGKQAIPDRLQGVTKQRIAEVLRVLDLETPDMIDAVFAMLDDCLTSWFSNSPAGARFCDGATTAHIGCHVGILQRGTAKLDREGRDYWIKPLRDIAAVEAIFLDSKSRTFLPGHPVAKSSNSAYRLAEEFRTILRAPEKEWRTIITAWNKKDRIRERREFQARIAEETRRKIDTKHADLIRACCEEYAPRFLPGFEVVYVDDSDGDRISDEDRETLSAAGLTITLDDPMPDVLLHNRETNELWVIEAVTSDGEVDEHKVRRMCAFADRNGKETTYFTTAYPTWKLAAQRQGKHKNIAPTTYVWIREDGSKHYRADAFRV